MGISPGDPVAPDAPFIALNGTDNYLAKAWDDRAGCAVIVEAMRRLNARPISESDFLDHHHSGRDRAARRAHRRGRGEAGSRDRA